MSRMSTMFEWIAGGLAVCAVAAYIVLRRNSASAAVSSRTLKIDNLERKVINGEMPFTDIVGWFKTIPNLNQKVDTPFMAKASELPQIMQGITLSLDLQLTSGKQSLLLGVYNEEKKAITHSVLVEPDSLDAKTREVLGSESLVVLN